MFARELDVSESDIVIIDAKPNITLDEKQYQALLNWRSMNGERATKVALVQVLKDMRHRDAAGKYHPLYFDGLVQDCSNSS